MSEVIEDGKEFRVGGVPTGGMPSDPTRLALFRCGWCSNYQRERTTCRRCGGRME